MEKESFLKIVEILKRVDNNVMLLDKIGIDIIDSTFLNDFYYLSNFIIKKEYGEEGLDWFNWWMFEFPSIKTDDSNAVYARDKYGNPIILDTAEQLYDFIEKEF